MSSYTPTHRTRPDTAPGYGIAEHHEGMLDWSLVTERLTASRNYWVVTVRAGGERPHAAPVWGVFVNGAVYFGTDRGSLKARNLEARPDLVIHLESGDDAVILEGRAVEVTDADELLALDGPYAEKYDWHPFGDPPDVPGDALYFRVRPTRALAWVEHDFPNTATRFHFEDAH